MSLARIRITTMQLGGMFPATLPALLAISAIAGTVALGACGAKAVDIEAARNSGYETDFARVYGVALQAVRKNYPNLTENASAGIIKTSWHPVRLATQDSTFQSDQPMRNRNQLMNPQSVQQLNNPMLQAQRNRTRNRKLYFVRFRIQVVGGDPWRVSVVGEASEWAEGNVPSPLYGANVPPWLAGRVNAVRVAIHKKLARYAVELPSTAIADAPPPEPQAVEVDQSHLGSLPPPAMKAVVDALGAAKERDYKELKKSMQPDFTWSLGADPSASQALMMWRADSSILARMTAALEAGCALVESGSAAVCPAIAARADAGYQGYRARFVKGAKGAWKMASFIEGE